MTGADKEAFAAVMLGLAANYGKALDKVGLAFFFRMLSAYDIKDIDRAAMSIAATRKYTSMPTVADFIEHLSGGNLDDLAEVEAGKVLQAVAKHGPYASVAFDDASTQAVIVEGYGGWEGVCEVSAQEREKWFRKDFVKVWTAYKRQGRVHYGALPGIQALQNSLLGYYEHVPAPELVGDAAKATAVLEAGAKRPALAGGKAAGAVMPELARALNLAPRETEQKEGPAG